MWHLNMTECQCEIMNMDGTAENVNEKQKIMTTVWWHWMWIHASNEMKGWKQCDGTECEGIWVMKWIDGNSDGTAENVNEI